MTEIKDYKIRIYKQINDGIQDMKDFQSNSIGDFLEDIDVIIKQLNLSLLLKISDVIKNKKNTKRFSWSLYSRKMLSFLPELHISCILDII